MFGTDFPESAFGFIIGIGIVLLRCAGIGLGIVFLVLASTIETMTVPPSSSI